MNFTKITRITRTAEIRKISEGPNENYKNCEYSQRYQEWLTRCKRDPTRTANFAKITRITRTAKIPRISEGPNENYENYENSQRFQEIPQGKLLKNQRLQLEKLHHQL